MRLSEYLKSERAPRDVRVLLARQAKAPGSEFSVQPAGSRGKLGDWWLRNTKPWVGIELRFDDEDKCDIDRDDVRCYFRQESGLVLVSDCGEAVCSAMKRTHHDGEQIQTLVHDLLERGVDLTDPHAPFLGGSAIQRRCPIEMLSAAIVSVVSAATRVRDEVPR